MKCEKHPGIDAIGICTSCRRGMCSECKVMFGDKLHCKDCIEGGRISQKTSPLPPGPPGPHPGPMPIPPFIPFMVPTFRRPPDSAKIKWGFIGALISSIFSFLIAPSMFFSFLDNMNYYFPLVLFGIFILIGLVLIINAFREIHRATLFPGINLALFTLLIGFLVQFGILVPDFIASIVLSDSSIYYRTPVFLFIGYISFGICLIIFSFLFRRIKLEFLFPTVRRSLAIGVFISFLLSGIIFVAFFLFIFIIMFGSIVIQWAFLGVAFLLLALLLYQAQKFRPVEGQPSPPQAPPSSGSLPLTGPSPP